MKLYTQMQNHLGEKKNAFYTLKGNWNVLLFLIGVIKTSLENVFSFLFLHFRGKFSLIYILYFEIKECLGF